jgi:hypothetical protein
MVRRGALSAVAVLSAVNLVPVVAIACSCRCEPVILLVLVVYFRHRSRR